jgi:hypothetical protein
LLTTEGLQPTATAFDVVPLLPADVVEVPDDESPCAMPSKILVGAESSRVGSLAGGVAGDLLSRTTAAAPHLSSKFTINAGHLGTSMLACAIAVPQDQISATQNKRQIIAEGKIFIFQLTAEAEVNQSIMPAIQRFCN